MIQLFRKVAGLAIACIAKVKPKGARVSVDALRKKDKYVYFQV
jgi:hypothetical protein